MLATYAFLAFWIIVGLALFFVAFRGGPRGARGAAPQSRASRRAELALFAVFALVIGAAVPLSVMIGNADSTDARASSSTIKLTAQEEDGREIFGRECAYCHTLTAAGADGKVGPNLDQLRPPRELVLDAVIRGRQRGAGTMPAGLATDQDAEALAAFVAAVAGR